MSELEKIKEWLSDGNTWVAGFENMAPDSFSLGDRCLFPINNGFWDKVTVGETRAPDTDQFIGWRYVLQQKFRDAQKAYDWYKGIGEFDLPKPN
jgi:hypothetical protein